MTSQTSISGVQLSLYVHARARHQGQLLSEWLLEQARRAGIGGGSVFRAIAGYGRHGVLHEEQFFDLVDDLPVKLEFLLSAAQAESLLQQLREQRVDAVYASAPAEFGLLGSD